MHVETLVRSFQHLSFYAKDYGLDFVVVEQMYTPNEPPYTIAQTRDILARINENAGVPVKLASIWDTPLRRTTHIQRRMLTLTSG